MINVFMVDSNLSTIKEVKQYFSSSSSICIKETCSDGSIALDKLISNSYDILLINPILPNLDGIGILKKLEEKNIKIKTIIYSDYNNANVISNLYNFDICFYLLKSVGYELLEERIVEASNIKYQEYEIIDNRIIDSKMVEIVSKLLHDLGMPSHIKGYQYIRDAIIMMHEDSKYFGSITKVLYPTIADKYNTTPSRVERAIRHAIEVSWTRGDYDLMDEIFGHSVDFDRAKPTNSEFLATLADKITLDETKIKYKSYN